MPINQESALRRLYKSMKHRLLSPRHKKGNEKDMSVFLSIFVFHYKRSLNSLGFVLPIIWWLLFQIGTQRTDLM